MLRSEGVMTFWQSLHLQSAGYNNMGISWGCYVLMNGGGILEVTAFMGHALENRELSFFVQSGD
jgi:hypothetical protein